MHKGRGIDMREEYPKHESAVINQRRPQGKGALPQLSNLVKADEMFASRDLRRPSGKTKHEGPLLIGGHGIVMNGEASKMSARNCH